MKLSMPLFLILVISNSSLQASCKEECKKKYDRCKARVHMEGGYSYFKCMNEEKECDGSCKRQG